MSNPKDLGLQGVAEKMDELTERLIGALRDTALDYQHARDNNKETRWSDVTRAENSLRNRIRALVSEARMEAGKDLMRVIGVRSDEYKSERK